MKKIRGGMAEMGATGDKRIYNGEGEEKGGRRE